MSVIHSSGEAAATIRKRIISAGVPNVFARTAVLRQLVLEAPAPVVAGMLGFHSVHTAFVTKQAGADWSRYAAGDHARSPAGWAPRQKCDAL